MINAEGISNEAPQVSPPFRAVFWLFWLSEKKSLDDNTEQRLFESAIEAGVNVTFDILQPTDWSTDGRLIAFNYVNQSGMKTNLWILPLSGGAKPFW